MQPSSLFCFPNRGVKGPGAARGLERVIVRQEAEISIHLRLVQRIIQPHIVWLRKLDVSMQAVSCNQHSLAPPRRLHWPTCDSSLLIMTNLSDPNLLAQAFPTVNHFALTPKKFETIESWFPSLMSPTPVTGLPSTRVHLESRSCLGPGDSLPCCLDFLLSTLEHSRPPRNATLSVPSPWYLFS